MTDLSHYTAPDLEEAIRAVSVSERDRLVLRLRLLEHLSYQEISDHDGVYVGTRQVGNILSAGCVKVGDYLLGRRKHKFRDFLRHFLRIS